MHRGALRSLARVGVRDDARSTQPRSIVPEPTTASSPRVFSDDFVWGSATASYQIEGGAAEGGRTPSIWDTFSHTPGKVEGGDTGDVAIDHYHRWREDIETIKEMGLDAYRFSISWSRVQPGGSGEFNEEGIRFYSELLDALVAAGVKPVATLYHWDLPQELEDEGGWANRNTSYAFAEYAARMAAEFGDRVHTWSTLNEPFCTAYLGYASGVHAPGRTEPAAALAACHHLNLAHGLATRAIRAAVGEDAVVSVTLNFHVIRPDNPESAADRDAVRQIDALANRVFLGPMLSGHYDEDLIHDTRDVTDWSFVLPGDTQLIHQRIDVLGVNYYTTFRVKKYLGTGERSRNDGHGESAASPWVGVTDIDFVDQGAPYTSMGWSIFPDGLTELLVSLSERYPGQALMVTENGAAFPDVVSEDGLVHDPERVAYYRDHIAAIADAIDAGADVRGYFAWSLFDNFEWAFGYNMRFGILRVDYDTLERTWKDSGRWYQQLIATRTLPGVGA